MLFMENKFEHNQIDNIHVLGAKTHSKLLLHTKVVVVSMNSLGKI